MHPEIMEHSQIEENSASLIGPIRGGVKGFKAGDLAFQLDRQNIRKQSHFHSRLKAVTTSVQPN